MRKPYYTAVITRIDVMGFLRHTYHITVVLTDGDFTGHEVSFNIVRRNITYKAGDTVTVELWFKTSQRNGVTYHWLKGEIVDDAVLDEIIGD